MYRYIVGTGDVSIAGFVVRGGHFVLLLENDIFEYGINGYARHRNIGRDPRYIWHELDSGVTAISPNTLEDLIRNDGSWTASEYILLDHNCQDFVIWCLRLFQYY